MLISYSESSGWLTSSGTIAQRVVEWTVVDIKLPTCSGWAHDKHEAGDGRLQWLVEKLSAQEKHGWFVFFVSLLFRTLISHLGQSVIRLLSCCPPQDTTSVHLTHSHRNKIKPGELLDLLHNVITTAAALSAIRLLPSWKEGCVFKHACCSPVESMVPFGI